MSTTSFSMGNMVFTIIRSILLNNPVGLFVRMILAKLSLIVFIPAIMVTYWVLSGLQQAGVLDAVFSTITRGLLETQAVAQNCTPKILDIRALWRCLEDPGQYVEHVSERRMLMRLQMLQYKNFGNDYFAPDPRNPYLVFDDD